MRQVKSVFTVIFAIILFTGTLSAQANLKPSIGIGALPADSDSICNIPVYTGNYDSSGYQTGDTVPDFTLYKSNGDSLNLKSELAKGKPVLLVAGAYTCPVFRNKVPVINDIANNMSSQVSTFIIYVVEAHPTDPSPYSGNVWITSANQSAGILYPQPTTYGERKAIIDSMTNAMSFNADILIDGPCNNWWSNYGPAPNNSYLIDTNGVVFSKHPWFHKAPDDIYCDLDSLLGTSSGKCNTAGNAGSFTFSFDNDTIDSSLPNSTLEVKGTITNQSTTNNVSVHIKKLQKVYPSSWQTALCDQICHAPNVDTTNLLIPPSGTQPFILYFYTDSIPGKGYCKVGFKNNNNSSNKFSYNFWGETTAINTSTAYIAAPGIKAFPNPANKWFRIEGLKPSSVFEFELRDISGRMVMKDYVGSSGMIRLNRESIPGGIYLYSLKDEGKMLIQGKLLIK